VLGNGKQANVTYYYKTADGAWPSESEIISDPANLYRGTRFIDAPDGNLFVILSTPTGLKYKCIEKEKISGKIIFDSLATYDIHNNPGYNYIFAVFPERTELQSSPVKGKNFAYPGNDYDYCHIIKHIEIKKTAATGLYDEILPKSPLKFELTPNYPNPFNASTTIEYNLRNEAQVELSIYDVLACEVATLVNEKQIAGNYKIVWTAEKLSSGVYICSLKVGSTVFYHKMLLIR